MIILSFTSLPFWMYYYLGVSHDKLKSQPDYIIVMGGGGIPGESGLMRTYCSAEAAKKYPEAKIIIALPGQPDDSSDATFMMKQELVLRGVENNRISFETEGTNTRSQALKLKKIIKPDANVLIITSPEHMYRSVLTFKKAGLLNTGGEPAFEKAIEPILEFDDDELGGRRIIPGIGKNTKLRYQFWNHFKYQIIVYREYCAIVYYKIKGWI